MDALILPAREGVDEALHRARITPVERRVAHRSQRHVEVERRAGGKAQTRVETRQPFLGQTRRLPGEIDESANRREAREVEEGEHSLPFRELCVASNGQQQDGEVAQPDHETHVTPELPRGELRLHRQHRPDDHGGDADQVEDDGHRQVLTDQPGIALRHGQQPGDVTHRVPEEEGASQPRRGGDDARLHADDDDEQRLVVVETDAIPEEGHVEVAALVRSIDPAHHAHQHGRQRQHAEGVHFHDHRLAPHEAVETNQHSTHETRHHAQPVFPAARHALQFRDAFQNHAAAARDHRRDQAAGESPGHRRRDGHAIGDVRDRHQPGEDPRIHRPHRIAGRMRHARVKGAGRQFAAILQRQVRCQRVEIAGEDHQRGDDAGDPVHAPEQGWHFDQRGRCWRGSRCGGFRCTRSVDRAGGIFGIRIAHQLWELKSVEIRAAPGMRILRTGLKRR